MGRREARLGRRSRQLERIRISSLRARRIARAFPGALGVALGLACAVAPSESPSPRPTGLVRPFPPLAGPVPTADQIELGRLLFFDRVLSGNRDLACADCHRPDAALGDGRVTPDGVHGPLPRNVPTLYNVGFKQRLFWDRRAASLEVQVFSPLFSSEEMAADPEELLARLQSISAYRSRFARAFPEADEPITLEHLARALAAFERTLVSQRSRYDRWAAGERNALTAAERRGLRSFRSLETRCFECHRPPTFAAPLAVGIGVPSDDPGVAAVTGNPAQRGFFGVPTLRNVAATAPYMHDGSLATLEAVVAFYGRGGGRAFGADPKQIHDQIRAFDLSEGEAADLVAFLRALGDESQRPVAPKAVPSGLPVPGAPLPRTGEDLP